MDITYWLKQCFNAELTEHQKRIRQINAHAPVIENPDELGYFKGDRIPDRLMEDVTGDLPDFIMNDFYDELAQAEGREFDGHVQDLPPEAVNR